ncbi:hypothetical protein P691DRAFT_231186, partial [Macrolepiota fuliginosa MF-IS2]
MGILLLGMSLLGLQNCLNPSRHTLYQILTHIWLYGIPLLLYPFPQGIHPIRR